MLKKRRKVNDEIKEKKIKETKSNGDQTAITIAIAREGMNSSFHTEA